MNRVPAEIWAQIFIDLLSSSVSEDLEFRTIICCPRTILDENNPRAEDMEHIRLSDCLFEQRTTLRHITGVSSTWREAAHGCPLLWMNIFVTPGTGQLITTSWLKSSKESPLNVVIDLRRPTLPSDLTHHSATGHPHMFIRRNMETLIPHMNRIKSISITTSVDTDMYVILFTLHRIRGAPYLETLRICQDENDPDLNSVLDTLRIRPIFYGNTPQLKDIRFIGAPMPHILAIAGGITSLCIRCITGESLKWLNLIEVLRQSPQLQTLSIWYSIVLNIPAQTTLCLDEQVALPSLTMISVGMMDVRFSVALFACLDIPNMHTLCLNIEGGNCETLGIQLSSHRPKNHSILSNISDLYISDFPVSLATGSKMARDMHKITNLHIYNSRWMFYGMLTETIKDFDRSTVYAFPYLSGISLNGVDILSISTFVMLRKTLQAPLTTLLMPHSDLGVLGNSGYLTRFVEIVTFIDPNTMI